MSDSMKKYKEYIGYVVFFIPLIFAIVKYVNTYEELPSRIEKLEQRIIELEAADRVNFEYNKEKNRKQDSVMVIHTEFLRQDYQILINNGLVR